MEIVEGLTKKMVSRKKDVNNHGLLSSHLARQGEQCKVASMISLSLSHAGSWLNVVPSPSLGLNLRFLEFITLVKYRLRIQLYPREGQCPTCFRSSDRLGDHAICCGNQGEQIAPHNQLRDASHQTTVNAALSPTKEGRFLLPGNKRPWPMSSSLAGLKEMIQL